MNFSLRLASLTASNQNVWRVYRQPGQSHAEKKGLDLIHSQCIAQANLARQKVKAYLQKWKIKSAKGVSMQKACLAQVIIDLHIA